MNDQKTWELYISEAQELLESLESDVVELEKNVTDDLINNIYRNVHTIKGNSGIVAFDVVAGFAHELEGLLEPVRKGDEIVTAELIDIILGSIDWLKKAIFHHEDEDLENDTEKINLLIKIKALKEGGIEEIDTGDDETLSGENGGSFAVAREGLSVKDTSGLSENESKVEAGKEKKQRNIMKKTLRIESDKLDDLINIVGEIVVAESNVKEVAREIGEGRLIESVSILSRLIEDMRDRTLNIRMIPIEDTFRRFDRIVRDLSSQRGKQVNLVLSGGETELDKTLIEKISDPIMHIVRNSIDHGIDVPEERIKKNKPGKGTINLKAYHETGSVVIEISDDGDGLNRDRIFEKAVTSGLLNADEKLSDSELFQYILYPGFSTADSVTEISGRGVGMDVVKKNIESLRGTVFIESETGKGTTIRLLLPLTLAIIEGFMVEIGSNPYILPFEMVTECFEIPEDDMRHGESASFINLRGDLLPVLDLGMLFNEKKQDYEHYNVIVVQYAKMRAGFVVGRLIGEIQAVLKPLGKIFDKLKWISGATILGLGDVALILDVPKLIQYV